MTDTADARDDGYSEGLAGAGIGDNPFRFESAPRCWMAWRKGWEDAAQNRAEAAWEARSEPDDTTYRRDMKAAGRGHLLRR